MFLKFKIDIKKRIPILIYIGLFAMMISCRSDYFDEDRTLIDIQTATLDFTGNMVEEGEYETRAFTESPVNVEPNVFRGKFYIEINDPEYISKDGDPSTPGAYKYGSYTVPISGNGGMLRFDGDLDKKPNWYDVDQNHWFWSWTVPTLKEAEDKTVYPEDPIDPDDEEDSNDQGSGTTRDAGDETDETTPLNADNIDYTTYTPSRRPIKYTMKNTKVDEFTYRVVGEGYDAKVDSFWNPGSWGNGYILESLVGAKSGPYNYRQNGPEVPLNFHHLVSKISLRSLIFYGSDGSEQTGLKANITFINLPTEFTVYPHPNGEEYTDVYGNKKNLPINGAPVAVTNYATANENNGITYAFTNPTPDSFLPLDDQVEYRDKFYICPEVDFSKVQFKVEFTNAESKYTNKGEYWGNFQSVVFERDPANAPDYDNPRDDENPDSYEDDSTILHAGEIMYFDMIVRQSGSGGYNMVVQSWTTRDRGAKHYAHKGIYEGEESDIYNTSGDANWETMYELHGEGYWEGGNGPATESNPGIIPIYSDMIRTNSMSFPVNSKYVLQGNGYTLDLTRTGDGASYNISIGKMVDIYVRVGDYMIYIDESGSIFQYDPQTNTYTATGDGIDITGTKASYSIDIRTGKIN